MVCLVRIALFCDHLWTFDVPRMDDQRKRSLERNKGSAFQAIHKWNIWQQCQRNEQFGKKGENLSFYWKVKISRKTKGTNLRIFYRRDNLCHSSTLNVSNECAFIYRNLCVHMLIRSSAVNSSSIRHTIILPINSHRIDKTAITTEYRPARKKVDLLLRKKNS